MLPYILMIRGVVSTLQVVLLPSPYQVGFVYTTNHYHPIPQYIYPTIPPLLHHITAYCHDHHFPTGLPIHFQIRTLGASHHFHYCSDHYIVKVIVIL